MMERLVFFGSAELDLSEGRKWFVNTYEKINGEWVFKGKLFPSNTFEDLRNNFFNMVNGLGYTPSEVKFSL